MAFGFWKTATAVIKPDRENLNDFYNFSEVEG